MKTIDPIRSAALESQKQAASLGSTAEIRSLVSSTNPALIARRAAASFRDIVDILFVPSAIQEPHTRELFGRFREKASDIELTISSLSNTKVSRPLDVVEASLATIQPEMTALFGMAERKSPDPRIVEVVSRFSELDRAGKAYAMSEVATRKETNVARQEAAAATKAPAEIVRTKLGTPAPGPSQKASMVLGLGT